MDENLIYISDDNINIFGKTYINFNEYIKSDNILQVFQSCDNVIILTKDNMILIFSIVNNIHIIFLFDLLIDLPYKKITF